ncbi:hypothetical protein FW778_12640 [Ginsengibacter hankyongi]|uniref:Uncharacterized protein n=1 Tax=Ginsengibacter hankyongi TaxID=2607284 RepID=A0A5J5IEZ8_9BACT|nr:DUF6266 family protein [Ginsengibacter hankyongi]KAA9038412.1 hypothetical protein FW778_12640 [Ginsengibacter hankyongi]
MARIPNGITGEFIGTAGNVSGYMRFGTNFLRSRRRKSTNAMTPKRLAQQQKIKVCNDFTRPFAGRGFFTKTFPAYGSKGSGFNRATSALMNQAIVGSYPETAVSYPLVLVSQGPLPSPVNASAALNNEGNIVFSWTDNTGTGTAKANDKAVLVAYFPGLQQVVFSLDAGTRAAGTAVLQVSPMRGAVAETWMGFISNDEKDAADSVYTGSVGVEL